MSFLKKLNEVSDTQLKNPPEKNTFQDVMKNVSTQQEFFYAMEKVKRNMWEELLRNEGAKDFILSLGIPKKVFTPTKSISVGSFIFGKKMQLVPYKIIAEWFDTIGIIYEMIDENKIIYYKIFL